MYFICLHIHSRQRIEFSSSSFSFLAPLFLILLHLALFQRHQILDNPMCQLENTSALTKDGPVDNVGVGETDFDRMLLVLDGCDGQWNVLVGEVNVAC